MKFLYLYLFAFVLFACNNNAQQRNIAAYPSSTETLRSESSLPNKSKKSASDKIKNKIQGAWTDGSDVNASFLVEQDSIIYIEQPPHKYELNGDSIRIFSDGSVYNGKITYKKDTLILEDALNGTLKYWRFKEYYSNFFREEWKSCVYYTYKH